MNDWQKKILAKIKAQIPAAGGSGGGIHGEEKTMLIHISEEFREQMILQNPLPWLVAQLEETWKE